MVINFIAMWLLTFFIAITAVLCSDIKTTTTTTTTITKTTITIPTIKPRTITTSTSTSTPTITTSTTPVIITTTRNSSVNNIANNNNTGSYNVIECFDKMTTLVDDICECHAVSHNNSQVEVKCHNGIPLIDTIPRDINQLAIYEIDEYQMINFIKEFDNNITFNYLDNLIINNSTITGANITLSKFQKYKLLNLSSNDIVEFFFDKSDTIINNKTNIISDIMILDLSKNFICELTVNAFRTLDNLIKLYLRDNVIDKIDENTFIDQMRLENLDISDNKLSNLPDGTLTYLSSLQILNLSGNQLTFLGVRWFETLGKLRVLDVSRNGLTKAASDALQPLPGLSVLRLAENPLMERDVSLLLGTGRRLETVDASRTGLLRVPAALTRSVRALRLAGNKLTCIRDGDFDGYPLLKILDLSNNQLFNIEDDSLGRLDVLEELDLSGNKLKIIPQSLPNSLLSLNLRDNIIDKLTIDDFQGIDNIQILILDNNLIDIIDEGTFSHVQNLIKLDISNNPIKKLAANSLYGPVSLINLRMSNLQYLEWNNEQQHGDMEFPLPIPDRLVYLDVSYSPILAEQLFSDNAALSACKSLVELNLINTGLTTLRSDIIYLLPQLKILGLSNNNWNCTDNNLLWLGEWIRLNQELQPSGICSDDNYEYNNTLLVDLPSPPTPSIPSTTTTTYNITKQSDYFSDDFKLNHYYQDAIVPNMSSIINIDSNSNTEKSITAKEIENPIAIDTETQQKFVNYTSKSSVDHVNEVIINKKNNSSIYNIKQQKYQFKKKQLTKKIDNINDNQRFHNENKLKKERDKTQNQINNNKTNGIIKNYINQHEIKNNHVDLKKINNNKIDIKIKRKNINNVNDKIINNLNNNIINNEKSLIDEKKINNVVDNKNHDKYDDDDLIHDDTMTNTIAQELNRRDSELNERIKNLNSHPGMLILIGAIIGAGIVLTIILSRRATLRYKERYQRHENIEVHTLTPTIELW
ncbi:chaoptin-like [Aphidius gifuensis]|uniref:chaoptin-like n=1 Tax=Aphidius gifuensis TaxID=684658 RepID=UPI001CDD0F4B|nr:chaoptin-like [Aphidius gifuensis]